MRNSTHHCGDACEGRSRTAEFVDHTVHSSFHRDGYVRFRCVCGRSHPGCKQFDVLDSEFLAAQRHVRDYAEGLQVADCSGRSYSIYNGLNLTSGVWFNFYADYNKGIHKEAVSISSKGATSLDQYWQDGPQFTGWGYIVGKYPDGTPAIVEGSSGKGWVMLAGVHPEAPASWRTGMTFKTSVATDNAYAGTLILAALNGTSLTHY